MGRRTKTGICHICGNDGILSFEHVPPASAFNDHPASSLVGRECIETDIDDLPAAKGTISQRGHGAHTLCPRCNSDTGGWYGSAYANWAYQGMLLMEHAEKAPSLYHLFHIFPLRVIKQILCIFFSVARRDDFVRRREDLIRFVLNRSHKYLHPSLKVFAYFNAAPVVRQTAVIGQVNLKEGKIRYFCEFAFPPFGYILSLDGNPVDKSLADISFFSRYSYNQWADVPLRLPVFNICTAIPGDFRSRDQVPDRG